MLILIDLHDRTGTDDGKHGSVGETYKSINAVAKVQVLNQANRNLAPNLSEPCEEIDYRLGRYIRFSWRSAELSDWLQRQLVSTDGVWSRR
jgi:hypothetical protein